VECLEVTNSPSIGLVTDLAEGLVDRQQLVEHVAKIGLLFSQTNVEHVVTASGVGSERIERVANCSIPVFELEFALDASQYEFFFGVYRSL
jgi:hypothetical protein